jgi:hypothetical protein
MRGWIHKEYYVIIVILEDQGGKDVRHELWSLAHLVPLE